MNAPPPSTADYVRFHALHRPDAIAVIENAREIDYGTFHRDLVRMTRALRDLRMPRGSRVAVAWEGLYLHWLVLLACENLGCVTASFRREEGSLLLPLMARVDFVLCGREVPQADASKCRRLSAEWLGAASGPEEWPDGDEGMAEPMRLDEPQRIRRSSGTMGGVKMMVSTRAVEEQRVQNHMLAHGFTPGSRILLTTHFTVGSMFARATACLRLGAACIGEDRFSLAEAIQRHSPTHVRLYQFQMILLLDALKGRDARPADLTVMVGAAPLSQAVRLRLMAELASRLTYTYSSNETGSIAMVGEDGICTLRPGVQAEVIDENGSVLPIGEPGRVKIRTMGLIDGYLDNPEATARSFRDGWFHSGDAGMLLAPGRLKLMGRADDLLNIAGRKVEPREIEERVARAVPARDVGVTSMANADGIEQVCIAVVLEERPVDRAILTRIGLSVPKAYGAVRIQVVDAIPRTADTGKIRRGELKKLFQGK